MIKKIIIGFLICCLLLFSACASTENKNNDPNSGGEPLISTSKYSDLYDIIKNEPFAVVWPNATNKAMYGYTLKAEQGYNSWYYNYKDGTIFKQMNYNSTHKRWENGNSYINGAIQNAGNEKEIAKTFILNATGKIFITGNFKLSSIASEDINIQIVKNNEVIYPQGGGYKTIKRNDLVGWYHDVQVDVFPGDKINFVTKGNGEIYWNPTISFDNIDTQNLHFDLQSDYYNLNSNNYIGDVHLYYYNGKMYMYYLDTVGNYNIRLASSTDMISYGAETLKIGNPPPQADNYYVLGIVKEGDIFRSYFGASTDYIYGSKSTDLITWTKGEGVTDMFENTYLPKVTYSGGARDPYVFYDSDIDRYRIIYLGYYNNKYWQGHAPNDFDCALALKTSVGNSAEQWQSTDKELLRFDNAGTSQRDEPEVSQMMKIGSRWYIFASIYGRSVHGVGAPTYWIGDKNTKIDDVNWQSKQENLLDGEDLCGAQIVQVNDRYYLYGWIPYQADGGGWGGSINIAREIYQRADGTLATRLDPYLTSMLNQGKLYSLDNTATVVAGQWNIIGQTASLIANGGNDNSYNKTQYSELLMTGKYNRVMIQSNVSLINARSVGIKLEADNRPEKFFIELDKNNKRMIVYGKTNSGLTTRSEIPINISSYENVNIKIIIEGSFVEFFVNDEYCLTAKITDFGNNELKDFRVSAYCDGENTLINSFIINKLSNQSNIHN
jgi:hypothetical protein